MDYSLPLVAVVGLYVAAAVLPAIAIIGAVRGAARAVKKYDSNEMSYGALQLKVERQYAALVATLAAVRRNMWLAVTGLVAGAIASIWSIWL